MDSSEEKWGLLTNRKSTIFVFGFGFFFLFRVSLIVSEIMFLNEGARFFCLLLFLTEMTPVISSSSDTMNPFPVDEEKYMKLFLPPLYFAERYISFQKLQLTYLQTGR